MFGITIVALVLCIIICLLSVTRRKDTEPAKQPTPPESKAATPLAARSLPNSAALSSLLPNQFIVLDLETTGFSPLRHEIIEIAAVKISLDSDACQFFQTLVQPSRKVPPQITSITGITQQMLNADGIKLKDALIRLIDFVEDLPIVTYNAEFDMGFIHNAARTCGVNVTNRYACALKRARQAYPDLPNHKLAYLSQMMNLSDEQHHRALSDCHRTVHVFLASTIELNQKIRWSKAVLA
jgi:DNA polymerase-3 subunit epsilon